jgi:hypothetical protein
MSGDVMAERRREQGTDEAGCPQWCTRRHAAHAHPEDASHQSRPAYAALVTGRPWLTGDAALATSVVARLVRPVDSALTWLQVASEEGSEVSVSVTTESARQLVDLLESLLRAADG